jgi:hypothetical protein
MLCEYVWKDQNGKKRETNEGDRAQDGEEHPQEDKIQEENSQTYDAYRQEYCLNYVRSFFNEHMDDSWFRTSYSPLEQKRAVLQERQRASDEAAVFSEQVTSSPTSFIEQARLGNGIKEATTTSSSRKRKYSDDYASTSNGVNAVPQSHVFSTNDRIIVMQEVPPHVTDQHLSQALSDHCSNPSDIQIFSSSVSPTSEPPLVRKAYALVTSPDVRKDLLANLKHSQHHYHHHAKEGHVPRKEDDYMPRELDLDVDCSDPFGRVEVDQDGKGGGDASQTVPPRKATVVVSTAPPKQQVIVLSAAVSSKERIPRDKDASIMLARALDVSKSIPTHLRLDGILEKLDSDTLAEDLLDVSIAYLRRVHLFSFYNGCSSANGLGHALSGNHATGTIHLRLKGADELLEEGEKTMNDMLVMRLDDSINKAMEDSPSWVDHTYVLDQTRDREAAEIEQQEEETKKTWMKNHGVIDGDGRARCCFHFCRKLFKNDAFLHKHLLKKHGEFLKAEQAKCHDAFMMKAWDEESNRPVPPILVDCGANFGRVPTPVVGAQPMAVDPEPELWRREEEKRKRLEEEKEKERYEERRDDHGPRRASRDSIDETPRSNRPSNFVDVDDMKEEKVELSFENVEVVAPPPKKKKKKKKLL